MILFSGLGSNLLIPLKATSSTRNVFLNGPFGQIPGDPVASSANRSKSSSLLTRCSLGAAGGAARSTWRQEADGVPPPAGTRQRRRSEEEGCPRAPPRRELQLLQARTSAATSGLQLLTVFSTLDGAAVAQRAVVPSP